MFFVFEAIIVIVKEWLISLNGLTFTLAWMKVKM